MWCVMMVSPRDCNCPCSFSFSFSFAFFLFASFSQTRIIIIDFSLIWHWQKKRNEEPWLDLAIIDLEVGLIWCTYVCIRVCACVYGMYVCMCVCMCKCMHVYVRMRVSEYQYPHTPFLHFLFLFYLTITTTITGWTASRAPSEAFDSETEFLLCLLWSQCWLLDWSCWRWQTTAIKTVCLSL